MSLISRFKKQSLVDLGVVIVVILGAVAYLWYSGLRLPGWDINGKTINLKDETRTEQQDIFIRKQGRLTLDSAELVIASSEISPRNIYIEGASQLSLNESSIEAEEGSFVVSLFSDSKGSPRMSLKDSKLVLLESLFMYERSSLSLENSTIGPVYIREKSKVSASNSSLSLSLTVDNEDSFNDINSGVILNTTLESKLGWKIDLEDSTVQSFIFELYDGDQLNIRNSNQVELYLQSPGTLEDQFEFNVNDTLTVPTGEFNSEWFGIAWENTTFSYTSVLLRGSDSLRLTAPRVKQFSVGSTSNLELTGSTLLCNYCRINENGKVLLTSVSREQNGTEDSSGQRIIVNGLGTLTVVDSDIRGMEIIVTAGGSLEIVNSQFDKDLITFESQGTYTIDGQTQETE